MRALFFALALALVPLLASAAKWLAFDTRAQLEPARAAAADRVGACRGALQLILGPQKPGSANQRIFGCMPMRPSMPAISLDAQG